MADKDQGPLIIRLDGDWDLARKEELASILRTGYERAEVVLDLTETRYIDSTALAEFAKMRKHRVEHRGFEPTHFVVPPGNISKLLNIVGFDKIFPTYASLPEALQSYVDAGTDQRGTKREEPKRQSG